MAATKYTYSISGDFPNQKVDTARLTVEIQKSSLPDTLTHINTGGDDCDIWFSAALTAGQVTVLNGLVATHTGDPMPDPECYYTDRDPTVNDDETWGFGIGSCWFNTAGKATFTCLDASEGMAIWRLATENVWMADNEIEAQTNSLTAQDKLTFQDDFPDGNYRVSFTCEAKTRLAYILYDLRTKTQTKPGVTVIFEVNGKVITTSSFTDTEYSVVDGYQDIDFTGASVGDYATQTVKVQFKSTYGDTVYIRRARIEVRRNY